MKKLFCFFLLTAYCLLLTLPVSASYISLRTRVSSRVVGDVLEVSILAVNKGDESAHNVQAEIRVGGRKVLAKKVPELGVNKSYEVGRKFDLGLRQPGEYPLIVIVHYADANMYPFSALSCQTFSYKAEALPGEIFGSIKSSSFWKKGRAKLTLKNMGSSLVAASTYLVAPRELSVRKEASIMSIPPKSAGRLDFEIENFSALGGSTYQVFAISQYEKDGLHRTSITAGLIRIVESREILGISYTAIFVVLAILVLLLIAAQFWRKK
jgi:preprotein translocase subunit Sec61beta